MNISAQTTLYGNLATTVSDFTTILDSFWVELPEVNLKQLGSTLRKLRRFDRSFPVFSMVY